MVSAEGVSTDPAKIEVVKDWKRPRHLVELQSFLGFASYYRRFVEGSCWGVMWTTEEGEDLPVPLTSAWDEACEEAFQSLKKKLISTPVLAYADFNKPFILEVDAREFAVSAVVPDVWYTEEPDHTVPPTRKWTV